MRISQIHFLNTVEILSFLYNVIGLLFCVCKMGDLKNDSLRKLDFFLLSFIYTMILFGYCIEIDFIVL